MEKNRPRKEMVAELNRLNREIRAMSARLKKMEDHEGDDGAPEDIVGQCQLVDEIHSKRILENDLRRIVYPK